MRAPRTSAWPSVAWVIPVRRRISVVLPEPFGPEQAVDPPGRQVERHPVDRRHRPEPLDEAHGADRGPRPTVGSGVPGVAIEHLAPVRIENSSPMNSTAGRSARPSARSDRPGGGSIGLSGWAKHGYHPAMQRSASWYWVAVPRPRLPLGLLVPLDQDRPRGRPPAAHADRRPAVARGAVPRGGRRPRPPGAAAQPRGCTATCS